MKTHSSADVTEISVPKIPFVLPLAVAVLAIIGIMSAAPAMLQKIATPSCEECGGMVSYCGECPWCDSMPHDSMLDGAIR